MQGRRCNFVPNFLLKRRHFPGILSLSSIIATCKHLWPYVDLFRGRLITDQSGQLANGRPQIRPMSHYEPTSEKINIRPLKSHTMTLARGKNKECFYSNHSFLYSRIRIYQQYHGNSIKWFLIFDCAPLRNDPWFVNF